MSKVKLIALDMDGTLFNNQGEITPKNREVLKRAANEGIAVVVATGRSYIELPIELLYEIGVHYVITGNGSGVYQLPDKKCIYSDCLETEIVCSIIEELKKLDVYYDIYIDGLVYCPKTVLHNIRKMDMPELFHETIEKTRIVVDDLTEYIKASGKKVEKTTVNFALLEDGTYLDRENTSAILDRYPQIQYLCGGYHNWEFTRAGVTKGTGIHFLAEHLGVSMDQTMAVGDSENDMYMLKEAEIAVAMGNATEEIKSMSDFISYSNEESGVAHAVEVFVFGKEE